MQVELAFTSGDDKWGKLGIVPDIPRCHLGGFYDIISFKRDWRLRACA